jgi:hypothetical protein
MHACRAPTFKVDNWFVTGRLSEGKWHLECAYFTRSRVFDPRRISHVAGLFDDVNTGV